MPREGDFTAEAHDVRVSARLGLWLGVAFILCFATGLLSHLAQAGSWWPTRPVQLYRITQAVHVLAGIAAVPLLLVKLWSVYPRLFTRPAPRPARHAGRRVARRVALFVLVASVFFQLATGLFDSARSYPWTFDFVPTHYAMAWVALGALVIHVGAALPQIRDGLGRPVGTPAPERVGLSRRDVLGAAYLSATAVVVATAGATVPALHRVSPLSWRSDQGPQGLPVNRTAAAARVDRVGPDWRLTVEWPGGRQRLDLARLGTLPQRTARLPIACVEGWSVDAYWTGVPVAEVLAAIGAPDGQVTVESLERAGIRRRSVLLPDQVRDPLTLLALRLNGAVLDLDHGYPCRLITAARPGVAQTKWVTSLRVRP